MIARRAVRSATFLIAVGAAILLPSLDASAGTNGYPPVTAPVSGHIYLDTNGNGTQDPGEPDLAGVDVKVVYEADDCAATGGLTEAICSQTVTTDANGNWVAEVPPGTGTADVVDSTLPAGLIRSEGTDPTPFTAVEGQVTDGGTDGYTPAASASGTVYLDTDGDGTQDPGEPGISGVTITITDLNGTRTVTTDANGKWAVSVRPGPVTITINETTLPNGVTISEGSPTYTLTAVAGEQLIIVNGYKPPATAVTGSDATQTGLRLGLGLVGLGGGLVLVSRSRRRQVATI